MKKVIFFYLLLCLLSCQNNIVEINTNENIIQNSLTDQIHTIAVKYKNFAIKPETKKKTDKVKAVQMGVADAIGALLGSQISTPWALINPYVIPFGILWGGFGLTLTVEPYLRKNTKDMIILPQDSSFIFTYGEYGYYHNDLMQKAMADTCIGNFVDNNILDPDVIELFESNKYFNDSTDISINLFQDSLIQISNFILTFINNNNFQHITMINSLVLSDSVKTCINSINSEIYDIPDEEVTSFLFETQELIENSTNLSLNERYQVLLYIGLFNSSYRMWLINCLTD